MLTHIHIYELIFNKYKWIKNIMKIIITLAIFKVGFSLIQTPWKSVSNAIIKEATTQFPNLVNLDVSSDLLNLTANTVKGPVYANSIILGNNEAVARLRVTNIDAGPAGQVLNSILIPNPELRGCPLLGIDCTFLGGKRIFWGADYFPLCQDDSYAKRWLGRLAKHKEKAKLILTPPGPSPYPIDEVTGRAEFFSSHQLFCRPQVIDDSERSAALIVANEVLVPLIKDYMEMLKYELIRSRKPRFSRMGELSPEMAAQRSREYIAWNRAHDPATGLLKTWFSENKSEKFADKVLFTMPF